MISNNRVHPKWLQTTRKALLDAVGDRVTREKQLAESKDESENTLALHPTTPPQISPQDLKENGKLYSDDQIKHLTALCSEITPADIKKAAIETIIMMGQKATEDDISEDEINEISKFIKIHVCWKPLLEGRITKDELKALGLDVQFSAVVLGPDKRKFFLYKGEGADEGNPRHGQRPREEKGKHLGKGSSGKVKLLQGENGQWAAIKVITQSKNPQTAQEQRKNLLREVETLRKTAQLVDYYTRINKKGEIKHEIIMPYFPGTPLHKICFNKSTAAYDVYRIIQGSLHALNDLHRKGILHLDFKLENLIFDPKAQNIKKSVHSIDFGLSKRMDNPADYPAGTPGSMPPELFFAWIFNKNCFFYSKATDVYALGIVWANVCGMLVNNPLYKNSYTNSDEIQSRAIQKLYKNRKANIDFFLLQEEHSFAFKNAIPDPLTRENFLNLLREMTDRSPNIRPSTEKCIARLQDASQFPGFAHDNGMALEKKTMLTNDNRVHPKWLQTARKALLDTVGDRVTREKQLAESKDEPENTLALPPITPPQISPQDLKENGKLYSDDQIKHLTALCSEITPADIKKAAIETIIMMGQKATEDDISKDEINEVSKFIKIHVCWKPFWEGRITKDELRALGLDVQFSAVVLGPDQRKFFLYKGEGADEGNPRHWQRPEKERGKHLGKGYYGKVKLLQGEDGQWAAIKVMAQSPCLKIAKQRQVSIDREVKALKKTGQFIAYYVRRNKKGETKHEIIMPYSPGRLLHEIFYEGNATQHDAYRMIQGCLYAFDELHRKGVYHLDLKSENMLFNPGAHDIKDWVHLIDFGISTSMDNPVDFPMGTPGPMSPELFRAWLFGKEKFTYSEAIEVYALGIAWADAFGMLVENPLYEDCFDNIPSRAIQTLLQNKDANIDIYQFKKKCSTIFESAIPDSVTRGNFLNLLLEMTDSDPEKRPSIKDCMARLQDFCQFPGFAEFTPYNGMALLQKSRAGMFNWRKTMLINDNRAHHQWLQATQNALLECVGDRVTRNRTPDESKGEPKDEHSIPPKVSRKDLQKNRKLYSDDQIKHLTALCSEITPEDIKKAAIKAIIIMGQKVTDDEINDVSEFIKIHVCWKPLREGRTTKDDLKALGLDVKFSAIVVGQGQHQRKFFLYTGEGGDENNRRHQQRPETEKNKHLGKGTYGKVKLLQGEDGQWAAIKLITQSKNPQEAQEQEEDIFREIMTLKETGQLVGYYKRINKKGETKHEIIMPYFSGKPAHETFHEGNITAHDAYRMIQASFHALNDLHHQGILHLDIKSENTIFDLEAGNIKDSVHFIDFGFSKRIAHPVGIPLGSLRSISPELFHAFLLGEKSFTYSEAIDVYALGMTLADAFNMLFDNPLYENNFNDISSRAAQIRRRNEHANIMPHLLSENYSDIFEKAIPDPLTRKNFLNLIREMTARDPNKRPSIKKCIARLQDASQFPGFANHNAMTVSQKNMSRFMRMFKRKPRKQQKKQLPIEKTKNIGYGT